ncbi:MAG: zf-HC2 domain-containing protein [bacterium]
MDCKHIEELLWALCEGSLGERERRSVEEHLTGCPGCARARARAEGVLRAMRTVSVIEPSADFPERLWSRIDAWEARRGFWPAVWAGLVWRNRRIAAVSLAAFAVALVGGLYFMRSTTGPDMRATGYEGIAERVAVPATGDREGIEPDFVLRDIPYRTPVSTVSARIRSDRPDTIYVDYPTRYLTPHGGLPGSNYVYESVVTPVSEAEPIF